MHLQGYHSPSAELATLSSQAVRAAHSWSAQAYFVSPRHWHRATSWGWTASKSQKTMSLADEVSRPQSSSHHQIPSPVVECSDLLDETRSRQDGTKGVANRIETLVLGAAGGRLKQEGRSVDVPGSQLLHEAADTKLCFHRKAARNGASEAANLQTSKSPPGEPARATKLHSSRPNKDVSRQPPIQFDGRRPNGVIET